MKKSRILAFALVSIITFSSCSSDDTATIVNEEEVITTVTATFTPQAGGIAITLTSRDLDGDGPDAPVVTASGNFAAGTMYNGTMTFLNELQSPPENITTEIHEEGDQHQIFFQQAGLGTFAYADQDVNGNAIGLNFTYIAAVSPAAGVLTITLIHEPDKAGQDVAQGVIANAAGSTDAQVMFTIAVE
jgi:hypothetical protein